MNTNTATDEKLRAENTELRTRLAEAEELLRVIRSAEVDALVIKTPPGLPIFTLQGLEGSETDVNRFRGEILAQVSDAVIAVDDQQRVTYLNAAAEQLYGVTGAQTLGCSLSGIYETAWPNPEDKARAAAALRETGRWHGETVHSKRDGSTIHVESSVSLLHDAADGTCSGQLSVIRDITERKRAEEALRQSEERYHSLFEHMLDGLALCRMLYENGSPQDFIYLDVNDAFERLTGLQNVIGKKVSELIPGIHQSNPELLALYGRVALTGNPERFETYVQRLGSWFSIAVYSPVKEHFVAVFDNITERKQAEEALRVSEERWRFALHMTDMGAWEINLANQSAWRSLRHDQIFGYSELLPKWSYAFFLQHVLEEDRPLVEQARHRASTESADWDFEARIRRADGQQRWIWALGKHIRGIDGQPVRLFGLVADITARKDAEEKILTLNKHLESRVLERTAELHETVAALEDEISHRHRLEREILEISEREQCRLGQDLHDGLGQELAGIALLGELHAKQLQAEFHPSADSAANHVTYVRTAIENVRRLARGLYPIELDRYGLLAALKDLAAQTSHRTGLRCELRQSGDVPLLEKSVEIHIYRIVQECISNAIKHGKPRHISIEYGVDNGMRIFSVTDDGVGFDNSAVHSGMGLHLMNYRARVIGAVIDVETPAGGGCRIICRLKGENP